MSEEALLQPTTTDVGTATAEQAAPAVEAAPDPTLLAGENAEAPEAGAPESYETFNLPEGYQVDSEMLDSFHTWAKENHLPQDSAQAAVNLVIQQKEQEAASVNKAQEEWVSQAKSDQEFGGTSFDASIATAVKARDRFATPELVSLLEQTGLGNHPEMVRFFYRVGQSISEDKIVMGSANATPRTAEKIMYPDMT